jgi:hypothetical protein
MKSTSVLRAKALSTDSRSSQGSRNYAGVQAKTPSCMRGVGRSARPYNQRTVGVGRFLRFLNPDRFAGWFNRGMGPIAMADKAARGPGSLTQAHDPGAVVGVLGEIERQYSGSDAHSEDQDLPPLNFEPLEHHETTPRSDE